METRIAKYYRLKTPDGKNNAIEVKVFYIKGGFNMWTYESEKRGWYFSITPVEKGNGMIGFTIFSGYKLLVQECARNCKSAMENAIAFMNDHKKEYFEMWFPQLETDWEEMS